MQQQLLAISPIDGRYKNNTLTEYFSEYALIKYRVYIEIQYLISLMQFIDISINPSELSDIYENFDIDGAIEIKNIEATTNHDVKAVEYYIKKRIKNDSIKEYVHFGLTSQDINNVALSLSLKHFIYNYDEFDTIHEKITNLANLWINIPMLSKTHGQPASPTRLGKEFMVYSERMDEQLNILYNSSNTITTKFGGAVGLLNAHYVSYPDKDWHKFADIFVRSIGLKRNHYTTQIDHYDNLAIIFDNFRRICNILIDMCMDIWQYISMGYFNLKRVENEVGSSTMPHKVNPINFENAEGNLKIAVCLFNFLSNKLPISRLQRDLTDSTVSRNIGVPIAHMNIAIQSILKGLDKLDVNYGKIEADLNDNWVIIGEAIQTILRREGYEKPYEALKDLTRGNEKVNKDVIHRFIDGLNVRDDVKYELKGITPFNYIGKI